MGNLRSAKRKLKQDKIWIAEETQYQRNVVARKVVAERAAKDAEFAADLIKAVGENLPEEIKKSAEECIAREAIKKPENWSGLPEDPLLIMHAPPSDYPENRGMIPYKDEEIKKSAEECIAREVQKQDDQISSDAYTICESGRRDPLKDVIFPNVKDEDIQVEYKKQFKDEVNKFKEECKVTNEPIVIDKLKFTSVPPEFTIDPLLQEYDGEKLVQMDEPNVESR